MVATPTYRYALSETALVPALEAARSAGKNLAVAFDKTEAGEVIRIGYALVNRENPDPDPAVTWFAPADITRTLEPEGHEHVLAMLDVSFHTGAGDEFYRLVRLPASRGRARLRSLVRVHRSQSIGFAIQVEIQEGNAMWETVVRYDSAHGSLHRDTMSRGGQKAKVELGTTDVPAAVETAFSEIKTSISPWLCDLGYEVVCSLDGGEELDAVLNQARCELLALLRDPSGIRSAASRYTEIKLSPDSESRL